MISFGEKDTFVLFAILLALSLLFIGCGGGGGGGDDDGPASITVSGMAVGGAPVIGTLNIKDSSTPAKTSYSAVNADGSYTLNITDAWQSPFLLWIDGYVNNQHVRMLSCFEIAAQEQAVTVNITPATTAIVASAMGNEIDDINPETVSIPDQSTVDSIKQHVQDALVGVFAVFDMDESFDFFETPIDELGAGSDQMFDVLDFSTDDDSDIVVAISGNETIEVSIDQGGNTSGDIAELVTETEDSQSDLEQIKDVLKKWYALYETSRPDEPTLIAQMRPVMAEGFLRFGYDRDGTITLWATDDTTGVLAGVETLVSCSIFRVMQPQSYGIDSIDENIDDYPEALWVVCTSNINGILFPWLTSFVKTVEDDWKLYGNRKPFRIGGRVRARGLKDLNSGGVTTYDTGLHIYIKDDGNIAFDMGVTNIAIINPVMPTEDIDGVTTNCLRMARENGGLSTVYGVTNVSADYNWSMFRARTNGGLDIEALTSQDIKEFVIIGLDDSDNPILTYTHLLGEAPLAIGELEVNDADYFPVITGLQSFTDIDFQGENSLQWQLPTNGNLFASWSYLGWSDEDWNYQELQTLNPYFYESGDLFSWVTESFNPSSLTSIVREGQIGTTLRDKTNHREFRLLKRHRPWVEDFVSISGGELIFDMDHTYAADNLSDRVDTRARTRDVTVTRFEADVTIESASKAGDDGVDVHTEIKLGYQPDEYWYVSRNDTDYFEVTIRISYDNDQQLHIGGWVWGSSSEDGNVEYEIPNSTGDFPFGSTLNFNESHSVAVESDGNMLKIEYDGYISMVDMSTLTAFDPAEFKEARIRTRIRDIELEDDNGQMKVRIDNVKVNGQLYDDFNDGFENNKWDVNAYE